MPYYPNPAGGSMYAADAQDAASKGWTPSMGTFGVYSQNEMGAPPSSGGTSSTAAPAATVTGGAAQLGAGINSLLGAIASGNKDAFNEAVRQFNATFGLDKDKFAEAVRQYNEGLAVTQAGLTGQYQGAQTQQAQQQYFAQQQALAQMYGQAYPTFGAVPAGQETLAAQAQRYAQQMGMISQAASLQANPFRQAQALGQMNRLLGGGGVAGFSAPNTVAGVGVAGGNTQGGLGYLQQMIDDIKDPSANTASMNSVMQGIPTPNKIDSVGFMRSAPSTQNLVLQGMQEKYGLDPNDALTQIKNTLPQFNAPSTFGTIKP